MSIMHEGREWVTRKEAQELTGVSYNTIRHMEAVGEVAAMKVEEKNQEIVYLLLDDLAPRIEAHRAVVAAQQASPTEDRVLMLERQAAANEARVEMLVTQLSEAREAYEKLLQVLVEGYKLSMEEDDGFATASDLRVSES